MNIKRIKRSKENRKGKCIESNLLKFQKYAHKKKAIKNISGTYNSQNQPEYATVTVMYS